MREKEQVINEIIQNEWVMFSSVNKAAGQSFKPSEHPSCQDFPDEFRLHRESKLLPWSRQTLNSYLKDLVRARDLGKNLMTYKYARMDNLIPCENKSPRIEAIADQLVKWQKGFMEKYPGIMSGARPLSGGRPGVDWASFENYLRCELETYSEKTLEYLFLDIMTMKQQGKSMSEEVYAHLVGKKGYVSLDQAEDKMN